MPGLAKIALARLKANRNAPNTSGQPLGPVAFQGADHPDANLLAAFVEKALTERERRPVLDHLVQCAECRQVTAFIPPPEATMAGPPRVPVRGRWSPWLVLRWGAMAGVLGVLTLVVVRYPGTWSRHSNIESPPAIPAGNVANAPPTLSAPPLAQAPSEPLHAKAEMEDRESAGKLAAAGRTPEVRRETARNEQAARVKTKQEVAAMASSQAPVMGPAMNVPALNVEQEENKQDNALTAAAPPASAIPPAPGSATMGPSEDASKVHAESRAGLETLRSTGQSVKVTAASTGVTAGGAGADMAAKAAPRAVASTGVPMAAQTRMAPLLAPRKDIEVAAPPPAALWSVSADGKVLRSTDAGKTYVQVPIAHRIKFRAIAALGNDVWAGGAGGALFHSLDGGATWNWTAVNFEGNTITGIELRDRQHLAVTTASGAQWVSEDGGQNWRKRP